MNSRLIEELQPFVGKPLLEAFNDIQIIALRHHVRINIMDPEFNPSLIDNESDRLNVRTDNGSIIKSFTIG